jgi:D-serine deaminase-like pyridoxal phosphate-dependent protein
MMKPWYQINHPDQVPSPALLVFPDRVSSNIDEMIRVAGSTERLRPHVKTHKCREIVAMQQKAGINKFKCATIAEAEMLGECQVQDVLLAYQPVGPNITRYLQVAMNNPDTVFSALVDNMATARQLDNYSAKAGVSLGIFIDLDAGMHRTGIAPGALVNELMNFIQVSPHLIFRGWHVYDGHIRDSDFEIRKGKVDASLEWLSKFLWSNPDLEIVAGGSPTFPVHALNPRVNLSPGTCLLWDHGYSQMFPDQKFVPAAVLLIRIISKPTAELLCLDLGHKAVASEMPHPRVYLPQLGPVEYLSHSEEHLVVRTMKAPDFEVGDVLYGIPMHICPTTALHQELVVIENGKMVDRWKVYARDRRITC